MLFPGPNEKYPFIEEIETCVSDATLITLILGQYINTFDKQQPIWDTIQQCTKQTNWTRVIPISFLSSVEWVVQKHYWPQVVVQVQEWLLSTSWHTTTTLRESTIMSNSTVKVKWTDWNDWSSQELLQKRKPCHSLQLQKWHSIQTVAA